MPRPKGSKNIQPSKEELKRLIETKTEAIDDDKEFDIIPEKKEEAENKNITEPDKNIPEDTVSEDINITAEENTFKAKRYSQKYDTELKEVLGVEEEEEEAPPPKTKEETPSIKELRRQIKEYYKEFSHKITERNIDRFDEKELKEELLSCKNLVSKKNADSLLKYGIVAFSGLVEYIGVTRFDAPLQGYQNNISANESLDDIIKEIKIKYGFNKLDNVLSCEFRLLFLMVFTGYQTIAINKNREIIDGIKNKTADDVMSKYVDL
jgi:hypothetical protein